MGLTKDLYYWYRYMWSNKKTFLEITMQEKMPGVIYNYHTLS